MFGKVLMVFSYATTTAPSERHLAVFVRWFTAARHTESTAPTGLTRLCWEYGKIPGSSRVVPRCDVVSVHSIIEPVLIERDPTEDGHFFFNHFLRCGGR